VTPQPAPKNRLARRVSHALAAALIAAALAAPAAAASNGATQVHASCAGDVISGSVRVGRPSSTSDLELALLAKRSPKAAFASTGRSVWVEAYDGRSYPFRFDIGRLSAVAYRVDPPGIHGNVVPAASCAPGHQVPEAPLSLLLPLSVLGVVGLVFARRRRSAAES
jgi:hypothetical protein